MPKATATQKRRLAALAPEDLPTLHVRLIPAYAIEIEELHGIHPIGLSKAKTRQHLLSELSRRYPTGYTLEWLEPIEV